MKTLYLFIAISSANHLVFSGSRLAVVLYATAGLSRDKEVLAREFSDHAGC